jgi:hypothetical protein
MIMLLVPTTTPTALTVGDGTTRLIELALALATRTTVGVTVGVGAKQGRKKLAQTGTQ